MTRPPSRYSTAIGKLAEIQSDSLIWVKEKTKTVLNHSVWTFLNLPWQSHFFREWEILGSNKLSLCTYLKFLLCKLIQCKCVYFLIIIINTIVMDLFFLTFGRRQSEGQNLMYASCQPNDPCQEYQLVSIVWIIWKCSKYRSNIPNQKFVHMKYWLDPK